VREALANGLEIFADDSLFADLVALTEDRRYGAGRKLLVLALAKMKTPQVIDVLMKLLDDEEVACFAIIALGKLRAKEARSQIEAFLRHPEPTVRKEAKKALGRIDKARTRRQYPRRE
jgi:HEAT repeat protein